MRTHPRTCSPVPAYAHTPPHLQPRACTCAHTPAPAQPRACTCAHTPAPAAPCLHMHTYPRDPCGHQRVRLRLRRETCAAAGPGHPVIIPPPRPAGAVPPPQMLRQRA
eukprot:1261448-Pyramimonas_sp.AAC.1